MSPKSGIRKIDNEILKELKKCILVCSNCHREIHDGLHQDILQVDKTSHNLATLLRRKRMIEYLNYLGNKCSECGYNKCGRALDFHHLNPEEKEVSIGGLTFLPKLEQMKNELDKCIILCSNCHNEKHNDEYEKSIIN